ncbi:hypothetical protein AgCh_003613 [Apium graveolens]
MYKRKMSKDLEVKLKKLAKEKLLQDQDKLQMRKEEGAGEHGLLLGAAVAAGFKAKETRNKVCSNALRRLVVEKYLLTFF